MKYYYSAAKDSFFPEELKKDYISAGTWPQDLVEISFSDFNEFSLTPLPGKVRSFSNGELAWKDIIISQEDVRHLERSWRNSELDRSDIELYKVQDSDPKSVGSVSAWREYRKALRAWPDSVEFPDQSKRPTAPDSI
ncbi:hypothetical protein D3C85_732080 [compost metagenome]